MSLNDLAYESYDYWVNPGSFYYHTDLQLGPTNTSPSTTTGGRRGGRRGRWLSDGSPRWTWRFLVDGTTYPPANDWAVVGSAYWLGTASSFSPAGAILMWATENADFHDIDVVTGTNGRLEVWKDYFWNFASGDPPTQLFVTNSPVTPDADTPVFIELYVHVGTLGAGDAQWIVRANGSTLAAGTWECAAVQEMRIGQDRNIDRTVLINRDLYIDDTYGMCGTDSTASLDRFLGDIEVTYTVPDNVGTYSQFTPNTGSNFSCVDDIGTDEDSTYVSGGGSGTRDTYSLQNLPASIKPILCLRTSIRRRWATAATSSHVFSRVFRISGTDYTATSTTLSAPNNYGNYSLGGNLFTSPATGVAWTEPEVNAMEAGFELTTGLAGNTLLVTQYVIQVLRVGKGGRSGTYLQALG